MTRVPSLHLTKQEAVTLVLLVSVGGVAFDLPTGMHVDLKKRVEERFGTEVSGRDIANVITRVGNLLRAQGSESVVIDDDNG